MWLSNTTASEKTRGSKETFLGKMFSYFSTNR